MNTKYLFSVILVMALVTYIIRSIPMAVFRKKIKNRWIKSFLFYVPYVVLSAMTFPSVLFSTVSLSSAAVGCGVGIILAYMKKSLLTVAVGAAAGAFIIQLAGL